MFIHQTVRRNRSEFKIKDKLPSVEDLKKRLDMVEQELREYKENEEASAKDGNYTSNQEQNSCIILYFNVLDNSYLY